jgi:hypothetical protein
MGPKLALNDRDRPSASRNRKVGAAWVPYTSDFTLTLVGDFNPSW